MIIDLREKGIGILRYQSKVIPRVGENISISNLLVEYKVVQVDYGLKKYFSGDDYANDLVTIEVIKTKGKGNDD